MKKTTKQPKQKAATSKQPVVSRPNIAADLNSANSPIISLRSGCSNNNIAHNVAATGTVSNANRNEAAVNNNEWNNVTVFNSNTVVGVNDVIVKAKIDSIIDDVVNSTDIALLNTKSKYDNDIINVNNHAEDNNNIIKNNIINNSDMDNANHYATLNSNILCENINGNNVDKFDTLNNNNNNIKQGNCYGNNKDDTFYHYDHTFDTDNNDSMYNNINNDEAVTNLSENFDNAINDGEVTTKSAPKSTKKYTTKTNTSTKTTKLPKVNNSIVTSIEKRAALNEKFTDEESELLLVTMEAYTPTNQSIWDNLAIKYNNELNLVENAVIRTAENLRRKFNRLAKSKPPSGNPVMANDIYRAKKLLEKIAHESNIKIENDRASAIEIIDDPVVTDHNVKTGIEESNNKVTARDRLSKKQIKKEKEDITAVLLTYMKDSKEREERERKREREEIKREREREKEEKLQEEQQRRNNDLRQMMLFAMLMGKENEAAKMQEMLLAAATSTVAAATAGKVTTSVDDSTDSDSSDNEYHSNKGKKKLKHKKTVSDNCDDGYGSDTGKKKSKPKKTVSSLLQILEDTESEEEKDKVEQEIKHVDKSKFL